MTAADNALQASIQFYAALNSMLNGDAEPMAQVWAQAATVTTMHPVGGRQLGWDSVGESWRQVARLCSEGRVELRDQIVETAGEMAYELGYERGQCKLGGEPVDIDWRVTNIYRRGEDGWRIVHHHTDLSAAMVECLERLQAHA